MSKIKVMDAKLANMIAAGEVVERPSSVIKELVENSLDAEASNIEVKIYQAGRSKIVVTDDGTGMNKEDATLAFKRHASSKLTSEFDLFKIKTMGFRGEALPSIASVAKVTMTTSTGDEGTKVEIDGDEIKVTPHMALKGTSIIVEELFYNTPVRLKYLKTDYTENANSQEVMEHLALARPDVAFTFYIDDKEIFSTSGRGDLLEVIARIYGTSVAKKMMPIHFSTYEFEVEGFIGKPEICKSSRYYMITLLNQRNVYMPKIQKSIIQGYHDYLFNDRYPFVVLSIKLEYSLVDVNVHPSKKEVRISNETQLMSSIEAEIKKILKDDKPFHEAMFTPKVNKLEDETVSLLLEDSEEQVTIVRPSIQNEIKVAPLSMESFDEKIQEDEPNYVQNKLNLEEEIVINTPKKNMPNLKIIGQIHKSYIIAEGDDGFYLIDQHAANERINYERLQNLLNKRIDVVEPLIPFVIDIKPSDVMKLTEQRIELLNQVGLYLEPFGFNAFKVVKIPTFIKEKNEMEFINNMIDHVIRKDKVDLEELRKHVIATMACKASIKANDYLNEREMKDLLDELFLCQNPTCCPHGRPTIIHLSTYDIEKMFKRSGI